MGADAVLKGSHRRKCGRQRRPEGALADSCWRQGLIDFAYQDAVSAFVLAVVIVSQEWMIGLFEKRASEVNRIMQFSDRKEQKPAIELSHLRR
jgi:hypothetical protein